jgi:hypothetical protein
LFLLFDTPPWQKSIDPDILHPSSHRNADNGDYDETRRRWKGRDDKTRHDGEIKSTLSEGAVLSTAVERRPLDPSTALGFAVSRTHERPRDHHLLAARKIHPTYFQQTRQNSRRPCSFSSEKAMFPLQAGALRPKHANEDYQVP